MTKMTEGKKNGRGRPRLAPLPVLEPIQRPSDAPGFETGRDAFMRIAEKRINGLLAKLDTLSKLASSKSRYDYTDEDVEQIRVTLVGAVNKACDRLRRSRAKPEFKFVRGADAGA
jgi:hypothetical protein